MLKKIVLLIVLVIPANLLSNEISWPYLRASDYYRGTAGERLFFSNHEEGTGKVYFYNDLRRYHFENIFDFHSEKYPVYGYTRLINLFSLNFIPFKNLVLSCRAPYVNATNQWNRNYVYKNSGLSDIFVGAAYRILTRKGVKIVLATGLKLPTGQNFHDVKKIPIGTGSYDVPLMVDSNFSWKGFGSFLDFGFIFIGDSEAYPFTENKLKKKGNEIFIDYVLTRKIHRFSLMAEFNYFYIFDTYRIYQDFPYRRFIYDNSKYKLSIVPGILAQITRKMTFEIGYSYDLKGKDVYAGDAFVFRLFLGF